ncbi:hypothetical protein UA08_09189 [Talaromyces atroroseus]|uniref:Transcription factor domain-containing protein n=1 Tax=Talaromyces atroroseus TaxID=1441469 RepID=A0A1Q5Q6R3_TALAT|nr:hypothetical protein UA08_09189 [Talaromyces atroroseus]OKL55532.1 hypothetical protein UA08_09189 [Talaromyces atroroseus]
MVSQLSEVNKDPEHLSIQDAWFYPDDFDSDLKGVDLSDRFIHETINAAWEYARCVIPHFTNWGRYVSFVRVLVIAVVTEFRGDLIDPTSDEILGYDVRELLYDLFGATVGHAEMEREFRTFLLFTSEKASHKRTSDFFRRYVNALASSPKNWFRLRDCDALARFTLAGALVCNDIDDFWFREDEFQILSEIADTLYDAVAFYKHRAEGETHSTFAYVDSDLRRESFHECRTLLWRLEVAWAHAPQFLCVLNFIRFFGGPIHMTTRRYRFVDDGLTLGTPETEDVIIQTRQNYKLWNRVDLDIDRPERKEVQDKFYAKSMSQNQFLIDGLAEILERDDSQHCNNCFYRTSYGAESPGICTYGCLRNFLPQSNNIYSTRWRSIHPPKINRLNNDDHIANRAQDVEIARKGELKIGRNASDVSVQPPETRYRFRSYRVSNDKSKEKEGQEAPHFEDRQGVATQSVGVQCDFDFSFAHSQTHSQTHISLDDLQLFHNFIVSTCNTISEDAAGRDLWKIHVVQWSLSFHSIRHLILALSSLHLSHEVPIRRDAYVQTADDHFTFGLRSVTAVLTDPSSRTCQQVYVSAVLICLVYFGRGPKIGEYLVFSDHGPAEWRVLLNGVRLIVESHRNEVFTGVLATNSQPTAHSISPLLRDGMDSHLLHVREVRDMVEREAQSDDQLTMFTLVIDDLMSAVVEVNAKLSAQCPPVGLTQVLMGWVYRLPDEFVNQLEQKEAISLIVFAHWAVLLKYMQSVWFMKGWDKHVVKGVGISLQSRFHTWIQWPMRQVEESFD